MGDIMLLGVLRMPFDDHGDIHLIQLRQRCLTAAKRIEDDAKKVATLEAERDRLIADKESFFGGMEEARKERKEAQDEADRLRELVKKLVDVKSEPDKLLCLLEREARKAKEG